MKIMAIESSCDETAVAIVDDQRNILAHIILSQLDHAAYGGVVPEIAARQHLLAIEEIVTECLDQAAIRLQDIDAIAATAGPGLIGGVIVGVMVAKAIASALRKPFIAVNHLEGHALTCRLSDDVNYPYLLLLVSGGHCQTIFVNKLADYNIIGSTIDDSVGEAFDKVSKMMGLGYPGGPIVEKMASSGDKYRFNFPKSMVGKDHCNFSFSGLKTAVKRTIESFDAITYQDMCDICASFQHVVSIILNDRVQTAISYARKTFPDFYSLVVSGGVAANSYLKSELAIISEANSIRLVTPPIKLCTDNAAMIAWVAIERYRAGLIDTVNFEPKARWPISDC